MLRKRCGKRIRERRRQDEFVARVQQVAPARVDFSTMLWMLF